MPNIPKQHRPPRIFDGVPDTRPSASKRGYSYRWQKMRSKYLGEHPLCVTCFEGGIVRAATVVDHIVPHKGDPDKLWDVNNLQPLCKQCHDRKTAREDGGLGRNKQK